MKFLNAFLLASIAAFADAGAPDIPLPKVSVGLNVGEDTAGNVLGGVEPNVKWQTSGSVAGLDVEGGFSTDIDSFDKAPSPSFWGKVKKSFTGLAEFSIRGDVASASKEKVVLDFRASFFGTDAQVTGSVDTEAKSGSVSKIQLSKSIDTLGGTLNVNPSFDVPGSSVGAKLGYSAGDTSVLVDSLAKKLTFSKSFGKDTVSPSVTTSGDFSLSYSRSLPQGTLTTSWTPDSTIGLTWNDGEWQTTFVAPIDGLVNANQGIKVHMKRTVDFI